MSDIIVEKKSYCLDVKLNRPEVHNAFNPAVIAQLTKIFSEDAREKDVRVVLLSGAGPSFCAGADLNWMQSMVSATKQANAEDADKLFELFFQAASCPTPIVGRLHGNVMGGGLGLTAICDIAVAEADTKFCFSEVRLGIAPAVISSFVLKRMQPSIARELMITGQVFDAQTALRSGLVHYVARELEMADYINKLIEQFAKIGPEAVRRTKQLVDQVMVSDEMTIRKLSVETIAELRTGQEGQEGLKAFLEKRKPSWVIENVKKD